MCLKGSFRLPEDFASIAACPLQGQTGRMESIIRTSFWKDGPQDFESTAQGEK
jgi:hypothetical protein